MRILIVEDEKELAESLKEGLILSNYAVDVAYDGEEGLSLLQINSYDLLILDINLPKVNGFQVLETLRKTNNTIKVLILSARDSVDDKVLGLDNGANDYLAKPFHLKELLARIRNLLRINYKTQDQIIKIKDVTLNVSTREVFIKDKKIELRPKEFGILEYLMVNSPRFVSQEELLEHVWDENADPFTSSVRVYVSYLRKKLSLYLDDKDFIERAQWKGYRIKEDKEEINNEN